MKSYPVPPAWAVEIDAWILALRAAGRAENTVITRRCILGRAARAISGSPWTTTTDQLVAWTGGQQWKRETRRNVNAALRAFWQWGVGAGRTNWSPADSLPRISQAPAQPRPTPENVYAAALAVADTRTRVILRLAGEAGLRRAEIAHIHARDLIQDLAGWSLLVHGKGQRDRLVPLTDSLAVLVRQQLLATAGWLLPGWGDDPVSPDWVGRLVGHVLPDGWTLHTLRHRFATVAYAAQRDLLSVQQLLGHASVATTQRYVRPPDDALRRAVAHAGTVYTEAS